jgi:hypothetical protein
VEEIIAKVRDLHSGWKEIGIKGLTFQEREPRGQVEFHGSTRNDGHGGHELDQHVSRIEPNDLATDRPGNFNAGARHKEARRVPGQERNYFLDSRARDSDIALEACSRVEDPLQASVNFKRDGAHFGLETVLVDGIPPFSCGQFRHQEEDYNLVVRFDLRAQGPAKRELWHLIRNFHQLGNGSKAGCY